ncbi:VOC family protein [Deefgea rivuli]|uniref:VOC family protein n=1 Tax=Deefgea rivuli TaxID=400948 RepID=UPI0004885297|nr:VOC family protein [Deefgea rivuli]
MKNLGLNHINLRVPREQLEVMRDFYCDVVELSVGFRPAFDSQGYWLYASGHPVLHLSVFKAPPATGFGKPMDHIAFSCVDVPHFEARLQSLGIAYRIEHFDDEGIVQIFIKDPVNNTVELHFSAVA